MKSKYCQLKDIGLLGSDKNNELRNIKLDIDFGLLLLPQSAVGFVIRLDYPEGFS